MRGPTDALPRLNWYPRFVGAGFGIALGFAILARHGDLLFRPPQSLVTPASLSYPIAAASLILLGLAALAKPQSPPGWRIAAQTAIGLAILLVLARISDACLGTAIIHRALPVSPAPLPESGRWASAFGITAAASLLALACGEIALLHRRAMTGQSLVFAAAIGFMLMLVACLASVPPFDHLDAFVIGLGGLASVLGVLAGAQDAGFLAELAEPNHFARLVRIALLCSTVAVLLIGWLLARFFGQSGGIGMIGESLILIVWIWTAALIVTIRANQTDRQRGIAADHLLRDATVDGLTGLLNRNKMDDLLVEQRLNPGHAAMIMIDLDRFRSVNNALGTDAGDGLLRQSARRLANLADPHRVARAGGDEFAIFCNGVGSAEANRLGQAVVETIAVPYGLADGRQFHMTASVGVAHGATEGVKDLRDAADEAMYIAKNQGGNQCVHFFSALHQARIERVGLEQDLHRALKNDDELSLVYQPIVSLRDRRIVAIEALARWHHPQSGNIPPGRFVSLAEAAGMFLGLGTKLREIAVKQAAIWREQDFPRLPIINLNVSPLELARSDVPGILGALIDRHGLHRSSFCLEVTEGSFAEERALQSLRVARDAGFKIAMDDFGVGYSSLTQLPRLPLTSVKLDRSFLDQAMESEDGISLLATMVQLAHVLKLPVVAEGVETVEELNIVSDCGCDSVQGFLFSRPLTPAQLEPWLRGDHKAQPRPVEAAPVLVPPKERRA